MAPKTVAHSPCSRRLVRTEAESSKDLFLFCSTTFATSVVISSISQSERLFDLGDSFFKKFHVMPLFFTLFFKILTFFTHRDSIKVSFWLKVKTDWATIEMRFFLFEKYFWKDLWLTNHKGDARNYVKAIFNFVRRGASRVVTRFYSINKYFFSGKISSIILYRDRAAKNEFQVHLSSSLLWTVIINNY